MEYINEVELYGEVIKEPEFSHQYNDVPFYSTNIKIDNPKNKNGSTIVRCYFSGDQLAFNSLSVGGYLYISGKLVNSKLKGLLDISVLVEEYGFIEEITPDMENRIVLSGRVTKIFTSSENYKGFINFVIAEFDENNKRRFSSRVVIWGRLGNFVYKNLQLNDKVVVKGVLNNSVTKSRVEDPEEQPEEVMVSEIFGTYFSKITDGEEIEINEEMSQDESNE